MATNTKSMMSYENLSSLNSSSLQSLNSDISLGSSISTDQLCGKRLEEILMYFYNYNLHTDVTINVLWGESYISFPCHKLVLAMRSPVFASKFYGDKFNETNELEVSDVPPSAFEVLIKYCYGSKDDLYRNRSRVNFLLKVFRAAKNYDIKSLEKACCEMFSSASPTIYNVFELLDAAVLISSESLKQRCYKVLQSQTVQALSAWDKSSITPNVINTILDMPSLALDSEYDLINWLFDWGHHVYVKGKEEGTSQTFQDIMEPYISRLNLLSLKPEEFQKLAKTHREFFRAEDGFAIFMNIFEPGCEALPLWYRAEGVSRSFIKNMSSLSMS